MTRSSSLHMLRRNGTTPPLATRTAPRWAPLIGSALSARVALRTKKLSNLDFWRRRTASIQREQLRNLLNIAARTTYGREHDFARIAQLDDTEILPAFRSQIVPGDYETFRARLAQMREGGERDLLWPGLVRDFAQTSGTTAGDKYMPLPKQLLRSNFLAAMDIFAHLGRFGVPPSRLTGGRLLFLGGSTSLVENEHGVRTGDLSGLVTPMIRWPLSEVYLPGPDIALMDHWPDKIEAMARKCLREDVRMINGMPSWGLVLLERILELAQEKGPFKTIRDVWPNLEVFVHGGVKYAPFDSRMRQVWSGDPDGEDLPCRLELYPASEAFIAIQDTQHDPGLRLLSDIGVFYEFIPLEEIDSPNARAFTCDEVEPGVRYVVVITTCGGLWRYILGDVVEFDTVPDRMDGKAGWGGDKVGLTDGGPCRLRIVGRHRHFINAFGENLIVEHIENAVTEAARAVGVMVGEFTAAPVYPGDGRRAGLELAIEVDNLSQSLADFRAHFDQSLKAQNVDYTTKRTDGVGMTEPAITPLPTGTFHKWLEGRGKLGGQHKCPRCANHRDIIEGVLEHAGSTESS